MTTAAPAANLTDSGLYHGWMPTPDTRGTSDLLWSCIFTIFLCVWTAIHPPVPIYRKERIKFLQNWRKWSRRKIIESKVVPALISFIIPEVMIFIAIGDLWNARDIKEDLRVISNGQISIVHAFHLAMGGFCLRSPNGRLRQLNDLDFSFNFDDANNTEEISVTSFTEERFHDLENSNELGDLGESRASSDLDASGKILIEDWVDKLMIFNEDDIFAVSKADSLTKMITCFQALWFVTQVISRLVEDRAVTLLEVSTCAYVLSAFIAYLCWWKKPQNCSIPLMIDCSDEATEKFSKSAYEEFEGTWEEYLWGASWAEIGAKDHIINTLFFAFFGLPVFFGAIHVAAWNNTLPTQVEVWLWRSSTLFCSVISLFSFACLGFVSLLDFYWERERRHRLIRYTLFITMLSLYVVVRIYMIFEIFFSMRALPCSAYDTVNWSAAVPHI